jgi:hypothetical protein
MLRPDRAFKCPGDPVVWVVIFFRILLTGNSALSPTAISAACDAADLEYNEWANKTRPDGVRRNAPALVKGAGDVLYQPQVEQLYIIAAVTWKGKIQDLPWPEALWKAR